MTRLKSLVLLGIWIFAASAFSQEELEPAKLASLGLEELMQLEVSPVSKREEKLREAPAAVYVLTSEDLRRSGATSVPEALRLVPGLSVARMSSNAWAVTSRGFNGVFSNKLLVLVDGRSVYSPLYSGVFWEAEDVPLSQIERIEVIRGPGAALWGANAVNGVINVITKSSSKEQGFRLKQQVGNIDRSLTTFSYSGRESDSLTYRVFTNYADRSGMKTVAGEDGQDSWGKLSGGFRSDWSGDSGEQLLFKADVYSANIANTESFITLPVPPYFSPRVDHRDMNGANLTLRWSDRISSESSYQLQAYYQHDYIRSDFLREIRNTVDFDAQFDSWLGDMNHILFGLGYRNTSDNEIGDGLTLAFSEAERSDDLFSAFLQDDIVLIKDRLHLILGSKFEHNDYTGFEIQPGARVLFTPNRFHSFWAAVARAVRTPSRVEHTVRYGIPSDATLTPPGTVFMAYGDEDFDSEELIAYEAGYRAEIGRKVAVDTAFFLNRYDNLRTAELSSPVFDRSRPFVDIPGVLDNKSQGQASGFEVSLTLKPLDWMKWRTSYSLLKMFASLDKDSTEPEIVAADGYDPENQVQSWLALDFGKGWEGDIVMYYVDSLPGVKIPSYVRFDARVGYEVSKNLEVAVVMQNIFDSSHKEFADFVSFTEPQEIERSYYGMVNWRF